MQLSELSKLLNFDTSNVLKRLQAKVMSYNANTGNAVCQIVGSSQTHTFINKSGEVLASGDGVFIYYFSSLDAGFVGLRCGKSVPEGGGGSSVELEELIKTIAKELGEKIDNCCHCSCGNGNAPLHTFVYIGDTLNGTVTTATGGE